jgi:hypothetical protein
MVGARAVRPGTQRHGVNDVTVVQEQDLASLKNWLELNRSYPVSDRR